MVKRAREVESLTNAIKEEVAEFKRVHAEAEAALKQIDVEAEQKP